MRPSTISSPPVNLQLLLDEIHDLGRGVIAPQAESVDREAHFPTEAFQALKDARLLSCYVPREFGGMGLSISQLSKICKALATYCGSTAMIFAMHQIQVACIVHHALSSEYFRDFAQELVDRQLLIASATTELGIGGDVRSSLCAVHVVGDRFTLEKQAPVISYGEASDAILATCRRGPEAGRNDQSQVLVRKEDCVLKPISGWDTLGFRGTCSSGFTLSAEGLATQILPVPYAEIHTRTMHPFSHLVWSSLWLGIAADAVARARSFVRNEARKTPGSLPPSALRLAEVDTRLLSMRAGVLQAVAEYQQLLSEDQQDSFTSNFGFGLRINNLKVASSQLVVDIVSHSMLICGIAGYRNDGRFSLCRQLRDAYGAALMINNDRILDQSATMQILQREG
jgi:acyl-CoA dehydrogenase